MNQMVNIWHKYKEINTALVIITRVCSSPFNQNQKPESDSLTALMYFTDSTVHLVTYVTKVIVIVFSMYSKWVRRKAYI